MQNTLKHLFNGIAPTYDFLNHLLSFNWDRRWRKRMLQAARVSPNAIVLDVCTGTADIAIGMAKQCHIAPIVGIDFSREMLKRGWLKVSRKQLDHRIRLIEADALRLPFADRSCDLLTLSFGLRNLVEKEQGIHEMVRVLREQGQLVILEFSPPQHSLAEQLYHLYLKHVLPRIGGLVSRSPSAYRYLASSIEQFLSPEHIIDLLHDAGLQNISCTRLMFGIVYLYVAYRQTRTKHS